MVCTCIISTLFLLISNSSDRVALNQASQRGWFSYTDLCAVWEATDVQNNMLAASKQTAKVLLITAYCTNNMVCVFGGTNEDRKC